MKRRTRLNWYQFHRNSAEISAEERVRKQYERGHFRYESEIAGLGKRLENIRSEMPKWERLLSALGINTEYEKIYIKPLELTISEIYGKVSALREKEDQHVEREKHRAVEFYESSRQQRKAEVEARERRVVERRQERRIKYLETAPKFRQAARSLKRWLLNSFEGKELRCYYCGAVIDEKSSHLEHKTPLARRGTNHRSNLAIACASCNLKKGKKTESEFRGGG